MGRVHSTAPFRPSSPARAWIAVLAGALALATPVMSRTAEARTEFVGDEADRLARGETVVFDQVVDRGSHRYVGGTTYTIIDASQAEVDALFVNMDAYRQLLPHTKAARLIGVNDNDVFVELRQGNSLLETRYTLRVRNEIQGSKAAGSVHRFWLDRSKPHGIEDAWGYFRVEPLADGPNGPRVLLTYGILVDVGPGLVRDLFEERLRQLALTVPQILRRYALAHFHAGGRA
jgi:hypothetical protein